MKKAATENPNAEVLVRVVKFSSGASWHVANPVPVEQFEWKNPLKANGVTDMGKALQLVAEQLRFRNNARAGAAPCSRTRFRRTGH